MAFGITKAEIEEWKKKVADGEVALLTHFWKDERFPHSHAVTKAGCRDLGKLAEWGNRFGLDEKWIDRRSSYPHYDLMGAIQIKVLEHYGRNDIIHKFKLKKTAD
ncbi:hypothetical protein GKZ89_00405 [Bacillus mangrovi]|uniref:YneQ n=1 Tax=Metabacillus mangrovi TaxID=1491830 RepID=A0A7X2S275_9BACI|nr:hypothetical protein [Metabacillus mangrovi]MTH51848.1 hypothetical protein [Metabacillus mangrovi]